VRGGKLLPALKGRGFRFPALTHPHFSDDFEGEKLQAAVRGFIHSTPSTAEQFALMVDYCRYWFTAPCWRANIPREFIDRPIETPRQAMDWIYEAINRWAIDPL
jgi:hypothetical protein